MDESEWLTGDDPHDMLNHLLVRVGDTPMHDAEFSVSDRKLALFASACMEGTDRGDEWREWLDMSPGERKEKKKIAPSRAAEQVVGIRSGGWLRSFVGLPRDSARRAHLLREVVGNPFRPVTLKFHYVQDCPDDCPPGGKGHVSPIPTSCGHCKTPWRKECPWLTPTVLSIAQAAYDERDWGRLPVLADALEEAGCPADEKCPNRYCWGDGMTDVAGGYPVPCRCHGTPGRVVNPLLAHLRGPGPHVRGCWALDLILGRE